MNVFTRKQRLAGECSHAEYWSQYDCEFVRQVIFRYVGEKEIMKSTDEFFNDIRLDRWDAMHDSLKHYVQRINREYTEDHAGVSLSDCVCVAKQAARNWRNEQEALCSQ